MIKQSIQLAGIALLVSSVVAVAAPTVPPELLYKIDSSMKNKIDSMQWTMEANSIGRPILSGNQYRLVNSISRAGLTRQVRSIAANLGWLPRDSNDFNVRIKRMSGDGQVRYGDRVALEVRSYGWLRYKNQRAGINLSDDDNTPHYMWIVSGGAKGTKLVSGMPFALYNTTEKAEVTFCTRTHGIDLGWYGKSKCDSRAAKLSVAVFGPNGLFNVGDGLSGKGYQILKDHICEAAVGAAGAAIVAGSKGKAAELAAVATPFAIKECKERFA